MELFADWPLAKVALRHLAEERLGKQLRAAARAEDAKVARSKAAARGAKNA